MLTIYARLVDIETMQMQLQCSLHVRQRPILQRERETIRLILRSSLVVAILTAACDGTADSDPPIRLISGVHDVVSTESELLGRPVDMVLDSAGNLFALDYYLAQVLVISPSGDVLQTIGREGRGPGEFLRPRAIAVTGDTLRVLDVGNDRLQTLSLTKEFRQSTVVPARASSQYHGACTAPENT